MTTTNPTKGNMSDMEYYELKSFHEKYPCSTGWCRYCNEVKKRHSNPTKGNTPKKRYTDDKRDKDIFFFGGNREKVIQRDGEKCVMCGVTRAEHRIMYGRDLVVDHIDGRGSLVPKDQRNNNLENLQTLCCVCHGTKDAHKEGPFPVVQIDSVGVVAIYGSGKEAIRCTNITGVYKVLQGKQKSSGGYIWRKA